MIYCVEDEKNIRELLIYTLETTGFSAKGMANAKELRTALKEELPDLILLDGGKGHVAAIQPLLEELGITVPVFGMVKDDRHRTRAIAKDGGEIAINANKNAFSLITRIQDEVHRYTIDFSRKSHRKSGMELAMTSVEGIGPARAKALFTAFKTQKAMREATVEELAAVKGMTSACAQRLYDWLHADEE